MQSTPKIDEIPRKRPKPSHNVWLYSITLLFFSIIIVSLVGELLVRFLVPKEFYLPISNIYRAVDTDVGYTYKPNFEGTAFGVPLKTNSLGFRGPEWPLEKDANTVRIAIIGDSHAFGYGVAFKDTAGEKLADLLNNQGNKVYEVLNFGVGGYNSRQELAVFRSYSLKFKPDIIIIIPCSNDHEDALIADSQGFLRTATNIGVNDKSIDQLSVSTTSWLIKNSRMAFYLMFLKKQYSLSRASKTFQPPQDKNIVNNSGRWMEEFLPGPIPEQLQKSVYEPLKEIINEAKSRHISILLANFNAILDYRRLFAKLSIEKEVPSLELLGLFPEVNNWEELQQQFGLGWNNHLNATAHERWAKAIYLLMTSAGAERL